MFVLGLILILLSAGALVAVLASGTDDQAAMYGGGVHLPTLVVFLAGAAALLLFIMGLELVRSGFRRAHQNRKNSRRLRKLEKREEQRRQQAGEPAGAAPADPAAAPPAASPAGPTSGTAAGGPSDTSGGPATTAEPTTTTPAEAPRENPPAR